jgi:hypothetical protein
MIPFSSNSIYDQINIFADDCSGMKHISDNGNLWFTCNCPDNKDRFVEITFDNID